MTDTINSIICWLRQQVMLNADLHSDSRDVKSGDIFLAYHYNGADNHQYINDAILRGAGAILLQNDFKNNLYYKIPQTIPILKCNNLGKIIGLLSSEWYDNPSYKLHVVGITGTNGKTSCSFWIAHILNMCSRRSAIIGTLGSGFTYEKLVETGLTTPGTFHLQRILKKFLQQGAQSVIMEVSSHALHQRRVDGVNFNIAVFTNLTHDHLDYHGNIAAYEATKAKLFTWPGLRTVIINSDDIVGRKLITQIIFSSSNQNYNPKIIAYGFSNFFKSHLNNKLVKKFKNILNIQTLFARDIQVGVNSTNFVLDGSWGIHKIEVPILEHFNILNLLAVISVLLELQLSLEEIIPNLSKLPPIRGRMEKLISKYAQTHNIDVPLVIIDFAHTPDSFVKVLTALRPIAKIRNGQLIIIFGCGGNRDFSKRILMGKIASKFADKVIITTDNPRNETPESIINQILSGIPKMALKYTKIITDRANAILETISEANIQDVIIIAGKGHELTQEILGKKIFFSDYKYAELALTKYCTYNFINKNSQS